MAKSFPFQTSARKGLGATRPTNTKAGVAAPRTNRAPVKAAPPVRKPPTNARPTAKSAAAPVVKKGAFGRPVDPNAPAKKAVARTTKPAPKFYTHAPEDFKAHFIRVSIFTAKDRLPRKIECVRIDGRWDNAEPRKNNDLSTFDIPTQNALIARITGKLFVTAVAKRLRPNALYRIWIRVGPRKAREKEVEERLLRADDVVVGARVHTIQRVVKDPKTRKPVGEYLNGDTHKADPDRRRIRAIGQYLHGAFESAVLPPKRVRGRIVGEED